MGYYEKKQVERQTKLLGHLKALGSSPTAVAKKLEGMGIKGTGGNYNCPLAVYLTRLRYQQVNVSSVGINCLTRAGVDITVNLPKAFDDFVSNFDNSVYPNLIKV